MAGRYPHHPAGQVGLQHPPKRRQGLCQFETNVVYAAIMHFGAKRGEFGEKTFIQRVKEHVRRMRGKISRVRAHQRTVRLKLPWGDIPARPFMLIQPEDITDITELINRYLNC